LWVQGYSIGSSTKTERSMKEFGWKWKVTDRRSAMQRPEARARADRRSIKGGSKDVLPWTPGRAPRPYLLTVLARPEKGYGPGPCPWSLGRHFPGVGGRLGGAEYYQGISTRVPGPSGPSFLRSSFGRPSPVSQSPAAFLPCLILVGPP